MRRRSVMAVVLILVVSSLAVGYLSGDLTRHSETTASSTTPDGSQLGGLGGGPGVADLHPVSSIDEMFNTTLILPSAASVAALSPSLRLVGVRIDGAPANSWEVTIYYSNQTFVNGTTEIDALVGNSGLEIAENPAAAGVNSADVAQRELAAPTETTCQSPNGPLECSTTARSSATAGSYVVVQNGLSLFVNPLGHDVLWTDDRALMNVALGGEYTSAQLLSLAATMTSASKAPGVVVPVSSALTLNPATGLSLNLNLSTNTQGWVVVTAYEFNTLGRVNNVSYGSVSLNSSFFRWAETNCDAGGMEGYEVLQGDYGSNNFTSGNALWLQPQVVGIQCGGLAGGPGSYGFEPLSAENPITGTYVGYWSGPKIGNQMPAYAPFSPGTYTVVAGDEWGQVAILHFVVAG